MKVAQHKFNEFGGYINNKSANFLENITERPWSNIESQLNKILPTRKN